MLPSLRISYMVLNEEYYQKYLSYKQQYGPTASKLEQLALSRYIVDGYLEKHLRKLKKEYKEKNKIMKKAINKHLKYSYFLDEAFLSYIIDLEGIDEDKIIKKSNELNIAINYIQNHQLKLSFASLPVDKIEDAIIEIKTILEESKV